MHALIELEREYEPALKTANFGLSITTIFKGTLEDQLPVFCRQSHKSSRWGQNLSKQEDLNHTGAHKINNVIGQVLLAKRMGKHGSLLKPERSAWSGHRHRMRHDESGL